MPKNKNKRKTGQKTPSEPMEIGPGIVTQNFGRWNIVQSNRTPEEQAALMETLKEFRQNFPKQMAEKVAELEALIAKHNSFELLANLTVGRLFINPETYKETSHHHGDALVEYATLLSLKSPFSSGNEPFVGKAYDDIVERLEEIIGTTIWFYSFEGAGEATPTTRLDELHRETITAELIIRNPGYPHHLDEVLISLFQPFDPWLLKTLGFTITDLLSIEKAVRHLINKRFLDSRTNAQTFEKQFRDEFEEFKKSGYAISERRRIYFEMLRPLPTGQAKRAITELHAVSFFTRLGAEFSFTARELSEASGVTIERVNATLHVFSLHFGSVSTDFLWPKPDHPLKQQPFIQHEDRFMCPNAKLFAWAIRPMLERLLNPDTKACPEATKEVWAKYSDKRADFLEKESLRLLSLALRRATTYQNLKYEFENGGRTQAGELDGLVIFDKTLILVEAKAGSFPLKARAGFRNAIRENLKKLVAEAHEQALAAKSFIEASEKPIFHLTNGDQLILDKRQFERVLMMVVTLESLDIFCANLHQTADLGLFPSGELPWVLQLFDLRVIAEAIEFPSQLVHYLQRRLRVHRIKKLEAHDDLDWFGCYLSDGLVFDQYEHAGPDSLRLGSFTTDFDNYYFYKQGIRKTPTEMPRQKMPDLFRKVVLGVDASEIKGHSEAVCMLLDFDDVAKKQFTETLARQLAEADRHHRINNFSAKFPNAKFGVTCFVCPPHRVQEASFEFGSFVELMKYDARADKWLGVLCISGQSQPVGSWFYLNSPWREDAVLAAALADLERKSSSQWQKVNSRKI
ncbi:MAG: hypothetical protein ABSC89_08350 [Verrucomicrobiota bacterium]|jgi:hypothetical protein